MASVPGVGQYVGTAVERIEDAALLAGQGRYLDDLPVRPGTLYAAVVRSAHAHAELRGVDATRALALPGVRAVLLQDDLRAWSQPFVVGVKSSMQCWCLAMDRVRYVGEPVAVVVAETRAIAEDAAELVDVDYAPLPPVVDPVAALADDAPVLHPSVGSNCVSDRHFRYGDPEAAFASATRTVAIDIRYPRNSCTPIECGGVIAEWLGQEQSYDVQSNFMGPYSLHTVMAMALRVPGARLRHRYPPDSGGSFGVKQAVLPYVVMICLASRKAGAPVKWIEDRLEHLVAATSATARATRIEAAIDGHGRILALDYDQIDECGGYLRAPEPATFYRMHGCLSGAYAVPHIRVRNRVVLVNKTPTGLVRGFGGPQVYYALERLIQKIAVSLGEDPLVIAERNYVPREAFPYQAAAGAVLDSGDYQQALAMLRASPAHTRMLERQRAARAAGRLYGIGYASIVEPSVSNMGYIATVLTAAQREKAGPKSGAIASATVQFDPSGALAVIVASAPAGQGHRTVLSQVIADVFGLAIDDITVNTELDTQKDAWSVAAGNYSSRFAGAVAGAAVLAARRLRERIAAYGATLLDCAPDDVVFSARQIHARSAPDRALPLARVCGNFHWSPALVRAALGPDTPLALRETAFWSAETLGAADAGDRINTSAAYGFVLDACAVEIDPVTCSARIDGYITTHDAGTLLNPALVDGQIHGAFAQGIGAALYEEFAYGEDGSFLCGTFADYRVPSASEVPVPEIQHLSTPSPFTPLGAKGVGEGNNMSTPVCVANALADAIGHEDIRLPATPPRIHAWLMAAGHLPREASSASTPPTKTASGIAGMADTANQAPLHASASVRLRAAPDAIFAVLLDADRLRRVIPGCESILRRDGDDGRSVRYDCVATVRIGVAKARFKARLTLTELEAPHRFVLSGEGSGPLGAASGSGAVRLQAEGTGSLLQYDYRAGVSGKMAAVGARLLEGATRLVLDQLFKALAREAAGPRADARPVWRQWLERCLGIARDARDRKGQP